MDNFVFRKNPKPLAQEPPIDVYTDGACSSNPGIGGWGAILKYEDKEKEITD